MSTGRRIHRGRAFDRLVSYSDAVVAVAVTVLVLPLVDIAGPTKDQPLGAVLIANAGSIFGLIFTFFVVTQMWVVHNRIINVADAYDARLLWLNTVWLVLIVLLPWPSRLIGDTLNPGDYAGQDARAGSEVALFYWVTLSAISFTGWLLSRHIGRSPDLWAPDAIAEARVVGQRRNSIRGLAFAVSTLVIGIVWYVAPDVGQWLPLALIPLSIFLRPERPDA